MTRINEAELDDIFRVKSDRKITINRILDNTNIAEAIQHLQEKNDSAGADGVRLSSLPEYWKTNGSRICEEILNETYRPGIIRQRTLLQKNGKKRIISSINAIDRLLLRAISQILTPALDRTFSFHCYAYRPQKGAAAAATQAASYMEIGDLWVAAIDIHDYFGSINHELLIEKIQTVITDPILLRLLVTYIKCTVNDDGNISVINRGLVQGNAVSPVLSNLYLHDFDLFLEKQNFHFTRYGDDICIYAQTYDEAATSFTVATKQLTDTYLLTINNEKSGVFAAMNRRFLGYSFQKNNDHVYVQKIVKTAPGIYRNWTNTGINKVDHDYHLINDGIITKKDYTLLFENAEQKNYIPVETTNCLNIYSNVTFSSDFFLFANREGLEIAIFDRYGNKAGSFLPANSRFNLSTEIAQIRLLDDPQRRLQTAKKLENANIYNMRSNLRYYARRNKNDSSLKALIDHLTGCLIEVNEAKDINSLMLIEARARQKYYQGFNSIIKDDHFLFTQRTKRPPKDPLNSMISFGNTLLYQRIAAEIGKTTLDNRFAVLHCSKARAENLNLDLADLFKPIIVDRTIFTLINKKMLDPFKDFHEIEDHGIYISTEGKRKFIRIFESKLQQTVKFQEKEITYDSLLCSEIHKYRNFIDQGEAYMPYKYQE